MILYSKCSFRSGNGYQMGMCSMNYDCDTTFLPLLNYPLPEPIDFLFNTDFSNTVILATSDVERFIFLAIMGVVDSDGEKYINAVICEPNKPENVLKLFSLFTNRYQESIQQLADCIERVADHDSDNNNLDYTINRDGLVKLRRASEMEIIPPPTYYRPLKTVFAFITEHNYADYQLRLNSLFSLRDPKQSIFNQVAPDQVSVECNAIYDLLRKRPSSLLSNGSGAGAKRSGHRNPLESGAEALFSAIDPFRKKK